MRGEETSQRTFAVEGVQMLCELRQKLDAAEELRGVGHSETTARLLKQVI